MIRILRLRLSDRLLWLAIAVLPYGREKEALATFCQGEQVRRRETAS